MTDFAQVGRLIRDAMSQVLEDWKMQAGFDAKLAECKPSTFESLDGSWKGWNSDWTMFVNTIVEGECSENIFLLFPVEVLYQLAKSVLGLPPGAQREGKESLGGMAAEATQEMMNLLCGSFNASLSARGRNLRVSQSVEHLNVSQIDPGTATIEPIANASGGLAVNMKLELPGGKTMPSLVVLPATLASSMDELLRKAA